MAQANREAWLVGLGHKLTKHRLPALEGQMAVVSLAPDLQDDILVLGSLLGSTWQVQQQQTHMLPLLDSALEGWLLSYSPDHLTPLLA